MLQCTRNHVLWVCEIFPRGCKDQVFGLSVVAWDGKIPVDLYGETLHKNICFCVGEILWVLHRDMVQKSYMKIAMDFVEGLLVENKIFAYMRISTNHKTQKTDRQNHIKLL